MPGVNYLGRLTTTVPAWGTGGVGAWKQRGSSSSPLPWAREATPRFEALALTMRQGLPVRQAARMLRPRDKAALGLD